MVLVAVGVSFFRTDSEGEDGLVSHNRKYYAAQLLEAAYIKNGKVVVFADRDKSSLLRSRPYPMCPWSNGMRVMMACTHNEGIGCTNMRWKMSFDRTTGLPLLKGI